MQPQHETRQHRTLAEYLALECEMNGWDWITVRVAQFESYFNSKNLSMQRVDALVSDIDQIFPICQRIENNEKLEAMVFSLSPDWRKDYFSAPNDLAVKRLTEEYAASKLFLLSSGLHVPEVLEAYVRTDLPSIDYSGRRSDSESCAKKASAALRSNDAELRVVWKEIKNSTRVLSIEDSGEKTEPGVFYLPALVAVFRVVELLRNQISKGVSVEHLDSELTINLPEFCKHSRELLLRLAKGEVLADDFPDSAIVSAQMLSTDELQLSIANRRVDLGLFSLIYHQKTLWLVRECEDCNLTLKRVG